MKRRTFLQSLAGFFGVGAVAATAKPVAAPEVKAAATTLDAAFRPLPPDLYERELSDAFEDGFRSAWRGWAYRHKEGCKGVAFYIENWPESGAALESKGAFQADGRPIRSGGPIACTSCGKGLAYPSRANLEPVREFPYIKYLGTRDR